LGADTLDTVGSAPVELDVGGRAGRDIVGTNGFGLCGTQ
jgi:hypothetical protein